MSDTTRHQAPDERAPYALNALIAQTQNITNTDTSPEAIGTLNVTKPHNPQSPTDTEPTIPITHNPSHTSYIPRMVEALAMEPATLSNIINSLPDNWEEVNDKGTLVTKHTLLQCIWGHQTETDGLQQLQQAKITAHPPTRTNVTQYTCHLTSAISIDSTVWQHTIRNACQDHILPHPLHNPITIFNTNRNAHYTTLIADHNHYSYYDPLNFPIPQHNNPK
jgi:hypothetical protein